MRLLRAITAAGIVASLYAIAQYFDFDPFQNPASYHAYDGDALIVRPPGTMGHADYFGWWLAVESFCALALFQVERARIWRTAALGGTILSRTAVFLSGTRSAWLALMVGGVLYAATSEFQGRRRHTLAAALCLASLIALVFSPLGTRMRARFIWSAGRVRCWIMTSED